MPPGATPDLFNRVEPTLLATVLSGLVLMIIGALVRNFFTTKQLQDKVEVLETARAEDKRYREEDQKRIGALEREVPQVSTIVETLKVGFDQLRDEWHTGFTAVIERVNEQGENIQFIRGSLSTRAIESP